MPVSECCELTKMAQRQPGLDFHPYNLQQDPRGSREQQKLDLGNVQLMGNMQQNYLQGGAQQYIIPETRAVNNVRGNFQQPGNVVGQQALFFHSNVPNMQQSGFMGAMQHDNFQNNFRATMQHNIIPGNMQQNVPGHLNHSNYLGNIPSAANMFGGAPYTSFQGHFLVPVKAEVEQLPVAQLRDRFMEFVQVGRVNFDTLVFHTGSGELHRLGFYFNQHIMSIVVLNAMFNNSSQGDRAQFNQVSTLMPSMYRSGVILPCSQAPEELRLFNMQEQQKQQKNPATLGALNQVGNCE